MKGIREASDTIEPETGKIGQHVQEPMDGKRQTLELGSKEVGMVVGMVVIMLIAIWYGYSRQTQESLESQTATRADIAPVATTPSARPLTVSSSSHQERRLQRRYRRKRNPGMPIFILISARAGSVPMRPPCFNSRHRCLRRTLIGRSLFKAMRISTVRRHTTRP